MKNKFPKLNDALFQDEQLKKNALGLVVGGSVGDTYETTYRECNSYDSAGRLQDSSTKEDQQVYDRSC
jgi:hypothetical protein